MRVRLHWASPEQQSKILPRPSQFGKGEGRGEGWASHKGNPDQVTRAPKQPALVRTRYNGHPSPPSPLPSEGGRERGAFIAACVLVASVGVVRAEGDTVGLWVKNTSPAAVVVTVDGAPACTLEAPLYRPCHDKISQLTPNKKTCTTNNLKISCITDVKASGVAVRLKRADGIEYNVRAGKDANLYLCIEPAGLTDCFGTKLH